MGLWVERAVFQFKYTFMVIAECLIYTILLNSHYINLHLIDSFILFNILKFSLECLYN